MDHKDSMNSRKLVIALVFGSLLCLTACDGDDGAPGPPGPPAGVDIANATEINAVIENVVIASPPVVDFRLSDGNGNPVKNLPASAISFDISKLMPGTTGDASAWQSYINEIEEPGVGPGTEPKLQAITENGMAGTLVDNDGPQILQKQRIRADLSLVSYAGGLEYGFSVH